MTVVPDPKSIGDAAALSSEATVPASANGVLTVDLDALVANWRKLEKTAVPAECAGVITAPALGGAPGPRAPAPAPPGSNTSFAPPLPAPPAARAALPEQAALYV